MECLARLHRCCRGIALPEGVEAADFVQDVSGILERHNREMRKPRFYVRSRRGKTDFEAAFLQCYPEFYEKGAWAAEALAQSAYGNLYARAAGGAVCHGSFHQHNVLFSEENGAPPG